MTILMPILLSCFIQGTYSLQLNNSFSQPQYPIQITGFINSGSTTTYINWQAMFRYAAGNTSYYRIDGYFKGEWVHLDLAVSSLRNEISGTIHGTPISWSSMSYWISGNQECIP